MAGIKPAAMIETSNRTTFWKTATLLPRLLGVPLHLNTSVKAIHGKNNVDAVEVSDASGNNNLIDCDGVIFSGQFVSESSLIRASHLQLDLRSGGPLIDQYHRCSDPDYFACGNILHPVDTAGWCWAEGKKVAEFVFDELNNLIPKTYRHINIESTDNSIKYFTPQKIALASDDIEHNYPARQQPILQIRFNCNKKGRLTLSDDNKPLHKKSVKAMREKRQLLEVPGGGHLQHKSNLVAKFHRVIPNMAILAIDQGTTSTRALRVGKQGQTELTKVIKHQQYYPNPGWVEHDPEELISNIKLCIEASLDADESRNTIDPITAHWHR